MKTNKLTRRLLGRLRKRIANWGLGPRRPLGRSDGRAPAAGRDERTVDRTVTVFGYDKPPSGERGKEVVRLCRTPLIRGSVQIVRSHAPENLHAHEGIDGFWMVLRGRARFYGPGDRTLAELGPFEGILIPRATPYGFESTGAEDLELLQVLGYDRSQPIERTDFAPREYDRGDVRFFDGRRPSESFGQVPTRSTRGAPTPTR